MKYRNIKTTVDGLKFDSKAEARRWFELKIQERAGIIRDLTRQPVFCLAPSVKYEGSARASPALVYKADFQYMEGASGRVVVEDVKGVVTTAFQIKRHLMKSIHCVDVRLVK